MDEESQKYLSYLLRLWRTSRRGKATWRASLESAQTGERRSFADLKSLFAFLETQTTRSTGRDTDSPDP